MPELGKATYVLVLDSAQLKSEFGATEEFVSQQTGALGKQFNMVDAQIERMGITAQSAGGEVKAGMGEAAAGMDAAGTAGKEAAAGLDAAGAAATTSGASAARSGVLWGSTARGIEKAGKSGMLASMGGLAAAYFALKGGYDWLKQADQGWKLVQNAISATGGAAGVTGPQASHLADHMTNLTGETRGTNLQLEAMLMRFTNIRNIGPGLGMIYNRVFEHVFNIAKSTGRSVNTVTIALGKAMQDPGRYLMMLSRSGVTFTKSQQAVVQALEQTKGVAAAQAYVLHILDTRYGGLSTHTEDVAHKLQGSMNVQFARAKDAIYKASASIEKSFAPALLDIAHKLVSVSHFLEQHKTALRRLVLGYIAFKLILFGAAEGLKILRAIFIVTRTAILLFTAATNGASMAETAAAFKAKVLGQTLKGQAAEADVAKASMLELNAATLASTGIFLGMAAAVGAALLVLKHFHDEADKAVNQEAASIANEGRSESTKFGMSARVYDTLVGVYMKQGMSQKDAEAKAIQKVRADANLDPNFMKKKDPARARHEKAMSGKGGKGKADHYAQKPPKISSSSAGSNALGMQYTKLEDAYIKAQMTKTTKDDVVALTNLQSYLKQRRSDKSLTEDDRLQIDQELLSIDQSLKSIDTSKKKKTKASATGSGLIPNRMDIALQRAEQTAIRTGNYKPEVKALTDEQGYLQDRLKHTKSMKERRIIEEELTRVEKQLATAKKAELKASGDLTHQQRLMIQAAMDLRGTFFGQYASNLFPSDTTGKTIPRGDVHVTEHHHYNEIPKDRHQHARRVRKAVRGALS